MATTHLLKHTSTYIYVYICIGGKMIVAVWAAKTGDISTFFSFIFIFWGCYNGMYCLGNMRKTRVFNIKLKFKKEESKIPK